MSNVGFWFGIMIVQIGWVIKYMYAANDSLPTDQYIISMVPYYVNVVVLLVSASLFFKHLKKEFYGEN